ncbi:TolC family protein [Pontibacter sp. G13]|uniref:TolC family protein n=1 Tax=Pontibacter sp. G13 TaxID=3074898 RepID=UPI00288942CF|nr:TolC family protein [Pontibacter sp. G13]WNJ20021.1 TolC family protein [Pontibacter sp. G13]
MIRFVRGFLILITLLSLGRNSTSAQQVFTPEQLMWLVGEYHPISVQGELLIEQGKSTIRRAKGGFDPYIFTDFNQKRFDDKDYYSLLHSGLKVPTWFGVELQGGFEQNSGIFLNPENFVPDDGLWYGGISVPVGQGLFIDKRRAALKQAKIYAQSTEAERQNMMNDLYFEALKSYWKWVQAWNQVQVFEEAVLLAQTRLEAVKGSYELGDKPAIDTLEAAIQVQNREIGRNEALLIYQNSSLDLSNFLWYENQIPLVITDSLVPPRAETVILSEGISQDSLDAALDLLEFQHPEMRLYGFKLQDLEVEQRLKREQLKPKLDLKYNFLTQPTGGDAVNTLSTQNYTWGLSFSFPLLLRKQRGDVELANLKIQDTQMARQDKLQNLRNKLRSYRNQQAMLSDQVVLYRGNVDSYERLLTGERQKFDLGESSLFLVNSRETKLIEARIKWIELISKYQISVAGLSYSIGNL